MLRRLVIPTLLTAGITAVMAAAPASAAEAPAANEVADALKSDNVFVDPGVSASQYPESEREILVNTAEDAPDPTYYVILPDGAVRSEASLDGLLSDVQKDVGDGTYAVLAGSDNLVIDSTTLSDSESKEIEAAALEKGGGNQTDALVAVPEAVQEHEANEAASGMFGMVLLGVLALALVGGGFFLYSSKKKREAQKAKELAEIKQMATEDVVRLGEDIARLEIDLTAVDDPTRVDYTHAMDSYDRAKVELDTIQRPEDVKKITTSLEDGRYYMTATRARMEGEPVPERRQPCFFNPQHGPSQQDVMWAPPGGSPRSVTACPACAQAVLSGHEIGRAHV